MLKELEAIVANGGAKLVGLTIKTEPKLLKKNRETGEPCPFHNVTRISERVVMLGCNYGNCVNNQRDREGLETDFVPQQLWNGKGQHVEGHPFLIQHVDTGKKYIAVKNQKNGSECYHADGKIVDIKTLSNFMPKSGEGNTQGVESPVNWRVISLDNIIGVRYAGEAFVKES